MALRHYPWALRKEFSRGELIELGRKDVDIFTSGVLGIELWQNDPKIDTGDSISQLDFAKSIRITDKAYVNWIAGRRAGKTTGLAAIALDAGFYFSRPRFIGNPLEMGLRFQEYTILVISRTQAQANKLKDEAKNMLERPESLLRGYLLKEDKGEGFPILKIQSAFKNKQFQIHSRSSRDPDNLQGWNYDLVIVDEAVRIPKLWSFVHPTIDPFTFDTDGRIIYITSATRSKGDVYLMNLMGISDSRMYNPDWISYRTDSRFNTYLSPKIRSEMTKRYPTPAIADIYLGGRFPEEGEEMFGVEDVIAIFNKQSGQFDSGMVIDGDDQPFEHDRFYGTPNNILHCADIAKKKDWTVIFSLDLSEFLEKNKIRIVGFQRFRGINYPDITKRILKQREQFGGGRIAIDATGVGESVADSLDAEIREGFVERIYIGSNKEDMLVDLQIYIQTHVFEGPDIPPMEEEFISYTLPDTNLETDTVMALMVGVAAIENNGTNAKRKDVALTDATRDFFRTATVIKEKRRLF